MQKVLNEDRPSGLKDRIKCSRKYLKFICKLENVFRHLRKFDKSTKLLLNSYIMLFFMFQSTVNDFYVTHWYHFACIFESDYAPKHFNDISNFYLIKYEDQIRIIEKIGNVIDQSSEQEQKIKAQNEELFEFIAKVETLKTSQLQDFLNINRYAKQEGRHLKVSSLNEKRRM